MKRWAILLLLCALILPGCGAAPEGLASFAGVWTYDDTATRKENDQPMDGLREKMFWDLVAKSYSARTITIDAKAGTLTDTNGSETLSGPVRLDAKTLIWTPEADREQRYTLTKDGRLSIQAGGRVLLFKRS